jgi:nucleotide-binding universal stress UspA family protein
MTATERIIPAALRHRGNTPLIELSGRKGVALKQRKKILIAYDGSECADAALYSLERAGLPEETDAIVVSVAESWFLTPSPSSYEAVELPFTDDVVDDDSPTVNLKPPELTRDAEEVAGKAAKWLQCCFPRWDVQIEPLYGSPASELLAKSDDWKPDLIVTGSHGRSAIGRMIPGSISQKIVTEATCSVRIGRQSNNLDSGVKVLIGLDGSDDAAESTRAAVARAWPTGSEIRFVAVYEAVIPTAVGLLVPRVVDWVEEENRETIELARKMVKSYEIKFRRDGLMTSHLITAGDPRRVLVDEATRWGADCIFVGARGLSRIDRLLLGSVSAAVAARAHCSVEVVRSKEKQPTA